MPPKSLPPKRTSSALDDDDDAHSDGWVEHDRKPAKKARKPLKSNKDIGTCSLTKKVR